MSTPVDTWQSKTMRHSAPPRTAVGLRRWCLMTGPRQCALEARTETLACHVWKHKCSEARSGTPIQQSPVCTGHCQLAYRPYQLRGALSRLPRAMTSRCEHRVVPVDVKCPSVHITVTRKSPPAPGYQEYKLHLVGNIYMSHTIGNATISAGNPTCHILCVIHSTELYGQFETRIQDSKVPWSY